MRWHVSFQGQSSGPFQADHVDRSVSAAQVDPVREDARAAWLPLSALRRHPFWLPFLLFGCQSYNSPPIENSAEKLQRKFETQAPSRAAAKDPAGGEASSVDGDDIPSGAEVYGLLTPEEREKREERKRNKRLQEASANAPPREETVKPEPIELEEDSSEYKDIDLDKDERKARLRAEVAKDFDQYLVEHGSPGDAAFIDADDDGALVIEAWWCSRQALFKFVKGAEKKLRKYGFERVYCQNKLDEVWRISLE